MKNNKIAIIIASVAVVLTAVICALVFVHFNGQKTESPSTTAEQTADVFAPVTELPFPKPNRRAHLRSRHLLPIF